ncbi:MAG: succinylglutamate desuccinylase/aspartoacylase family protein [Gammaproteobacteria bacterium]|nr:succinylglutamate desuccinylase/aspartoacylase family protein [Gammaproteobacteria bacterium]MBU1656114.1 succinylglutamate desuccinylase/aspartoacylase family protein [Gammaproteobacteria bacterium]MBU1962199.1 succinylglutamate desuccinylase/aspartoacylase family protein [Gammaproteobacteria bacterium]
MLNELHHIPTGLLDLRAEQLLEALGSSTLIHLPGRRPEPLFVSVLLHGNETAGWDAIRQLLRHYAPGGGRLPLPRALSLFIGNVAAAARNVRRLEGQPDYNRVWPGCEGSEFAGDTPEHALMRRLVETLAGRHVFASIDIHNNTGLNPHYACVNRLDNRYLHLAALFGRTVVYFTRPCGVQSNAMARICPSVTLECGKTGQSLGAEHAMAYLDAALHLSGLPSHPVASHDIDLFHTVAIVKVPPEIHFGFDDPGAGLDLPGDLERLNFRELPEGTVLARTKDKSIMLSVRDEQDRDVTALYLQANHGEILTRRPLMPSMLTTNANAVRQDCLCYFMERYQDHLP